MVRHSGQVWTEIVNDVVLGIEHTVSINADSNTVETTIPLALDNNNKYTLYIKNNDFDITFAMTGADTLVGSLEATVGNSYIIQSDGVSAWSVVGSTNAIHTGDVTGSGILTIAADAVTYAKIQNVSATDRILGRDTAGAGDIEEITPAALRAMINVEDGATAGPKYNRSFNAYNTDNAGGTFNTVVCASSGGTTVLYSRHLFKSFDKTIEEAISVQFTLPESYVDGSDLKITLITTEDTASKKVRWQVGLTQLTAGGVFSDDTDTEYQGISINTTSGWNAHTNTLTFTGTNLASKEPLSIIVLRDTSHIDDDLASDAYLHQILIEEV